MICLHNCQENSSTDLQPPFPSPLLKNPLSQNLQWTDFLGDPSLARLSQSNRSSSFLNRKDILPTRCCWVHEELRGMSADPCLTRPEQNANQKVFGPLQFAMPERTALIVEDVKCKAFENSRIEDVNYKADENSRDAFVNVLASLKACTNQRDLKLGRKLHTHIVKSGFLATDVRIGNTLVNMYAKCEALDKVRYVFDELPAHNVVSWNVLISAYVQKGCCEEALGHFEEMQIKGFFPDAFTYACILKACGGTGAIEKGQEIHACIVRESLLEKDAVVSTALVDMYIKCDLLQKAHEVFDEIIGRNVVSWNALIAGYSQKGCAEEALSCFDKMQLDGIFPDAITFACVLKACGSIGDLQKGEDLHGQVLRAHLLEQDVIVGNALIDMYAKCGALEKAREVFEMLPCRDIVSWNSLLAGYTQHGHDQEALNCYNQMQLRGCTPDAASFVCILQVCGNIGKTDIGEEIRTRIVQEHLLEKHIMIANALVDMYAKCGLLEKAQEVFDQVSSRDLVSWNTLIGGYAQHGRGEEALACTKRMQSGGFSPDAVTFACILKACGSIKALDKGQEVHAQLVNELRLGNNLVLVNALIDMYSKCGALESAYEVFENLQVRSVVSWNTLLTGYVQQEHDDEVLKLFEWLKREGFSPDSVTFACTLKACGSMRVASHGQKLHAEIVRYGFLETDTAVGTALVVMYANCGMLTDAQDVFEKLSVRDVVSWNALIGGYSQQEQCDKALYRFNQMKLEGFTSDVVTYACVLKACGAIGAVSEGQKLHAEVVEYGLLEHNLSVSTAVLLMYANCCMLSEAQDVFDELPGQDVVSWGALMEGYSLSGKDEVVLRLFDEMRTKDVDPNWISFLIVLSTCSHGGLVDKGQVFFECMGKSFGIFPNLEQYICIIDMLGRAGHLHKALAVIKEMPFSANSRLWSTLLGACLKWESMALGRWVFKQMAHAEEDAATYVCLSNILVAASR